MQAPVFHLDARRWRTSKAHGIILCSVCVYMYIVMHGCAVCRHVVSVLHANV